MATACLLVSLGSRVTHLTLLISVTCMAPQTTQLHVPRDQPRSVTTPKRCSQSSRFSEALLTGWGSSPWDSLEDTRISHLGTSPAAGAPCWRISGTQASTSGKSGRPTRRSTRISVSDLPGPSHPVSLPCSFPAYRRGAIPYHTAKSTRPRGKLGKYAPPRVGYLVGCHPTPQPLIFTIELFCL